MTTRRTGALTLAAALAITALAGCGSDEPEGGTNAFCEQIAPLTNLGQQLESPDADLNQLSSDVTSLVDVAPTAVRPSVETIAGALTTMASAAEASGEEGAAALAAGFAAIEGDRESLERASEVVEGFTERECGLDLTPESTGSTTPTDSTPAPDPTVATDSSEPAGIP